MPIHLDRYNARVKDWASEFVVALQTKGKQMGIQHRAASASPGESLFKLKSAVGMNQGAAERVSIKNLNRSLIFTHYGAGRGRGGTVGSKWINKYGNTRKTDPGSFGKMGSGGRKEKPFITAVMEGPHGIEKLAEIAAEEIGGAITQNLFKKFVK